MAIQDTLKLKKELNASQYLAVTTIKGPLLVLAGAGTGKTRVIEYRSLFLVQNQIKPSSILLLTFTRKAAKLLISPWIMLHIQTLLCYNYVHADRWTKTRS
jgi:superfamily I DNA/RNA helicase